MSKTTKSSRPSHEVHAVSKRGDKGYWTKIGAMWPHDDGKGFNLKLDLLPLDGSEIVIRTPKPKDEAPAADATTGGAA